MLLRRRTLNAAELIEFRWLAAAGFELEDVDILDN
jgi:hypothetical protein